MRQMVSFNEVLERVNRLSEEEQEMISEIIKNRIQERRREEIARNAKETFKAIKKGKAQRGSVRDLKFDLLKK